ncbi:TPA: spore germination protein [Bacillus cereus]|nr:spore germination protein [Bacillus cereus]MDA2630954.1 spore germination protein [Bacillus cereus]WAI17437.1 spore germination protein [Bacillus cereus]
MRAVLVFIEGLSDKELIDTHIMKSLMCNFYDEYKGESPNVKESISKEFIKNRVLPISGVEEVQSVQKMMSKVLIGSTALLIDGLTGAFILNTKKELVIAFMKEISDPELVEEVKKRIQKINIDNVPESGYVEQLIEDNYLSPFPQVQSTERPDKVIAALMEGRVAILLDGTPFALIVPVTFSMMMQSPEDYYERWIPGTLIRLLRFGTAIISLFAPALYISFISFHPGLIPTKLAISIIGGREGVPFPAIIEGLFMEIAIEILREAGLRLPKPIGSAMGIVGGLIIGQAAVEAGIVSPIMVIVVAATAISSFALSHYSTAIPLRILRFVAMFFAAIFGLYGVVLFFLFICSHIARLKSFGVPYASPAVLYQFSDWKDFMVRMPIQMMKRRPKMLNLKDYVRKGSEEE